MTVTTFIRAAPSYWCSVYPQVCREVAQQRRRAGAITDPRLRRIALGALQSKRANVDGAAAFAAFVPAARRPAVIRAQVSFQALYDYLDTLTEQTHFIEQADRDPVGSSRMQHRALATALDPNAPRPLGQADCGYVQGTVERCQEALLSLPAYPAVQPSARRLAEHIINYQSFNITDDDGPQGLLARWAHEQTPRGSDLRWWETAASAGSSLGVFALIAMAALPGSSTTEAVAVEQAYFPWVGALHSLLDSLIDRAEDQVTGQQSLIEHYLGTQETARRLGLLATESRQRVAALPHAEQHSAILASMASLYLVDRVARRPHARQARSEVLSALGALAAPAMLVLRARQLLRAAGDRS